MKPIRFHPMARMEVGEAADFYEGRQPGLARKWRLAVGSLLAEIERYPGIGRRAKANARKVRMHPYPYYVIFEERAEETFIISFAHTSREPDYWSDRL